MDKIQEEIKNSQKQYQMLLENSPLPVVISDILTGQILYLNKRCKKLFDPDDKVTTMLGMTSQIFWKEPSLRKEFIESVEKNDGMFDLEIEFKDLNGRHFSAIMSANIVEFNQKKSIFVAFNDISKMKEAENILKENEGKLKAIFETAEVGISILGKSGKYEIFNNWWLKRLGYSKEEMEELSNLDITHPEDIEDSTYQLDLLKAGLIEKYSLEKRFICKNNEIFWGHLSVSAIRDENDEIEYILGIVIDISENKKYQETLKHYATIDQMTGIFNRRTGMDFLKDAVFEAISTNQYLSISFIDLNGLKDINDTLGHQIGDKAIKDFVALLKGSVPSSTSIARMGGDEFLVIFKDLKEKDALEKMDKLQTMIDRYNSKSKELKLSFAHGTLQYEKNMDLESLMVKADYLMYEDKKIKKAKMKDNASR